MPMNGVGILDMNQIITELMKVAGRKAQKIEKNKEMQKVHISTYGALKDLLTTLNSKMDGLNTLFQGGTSVASSSDSSVVAVNTNDNAVSLGSHQITIQQLAQAETIVSDVTWADPTTALGTTETLTFTVGSNNFSVAMESTDSLNDVANRINNATGNTSVEASVICVGPNQYQLLVRSSETGAANQILISGDTGNVFQLNNVTVPAQDALFTFDNLSIDRPTNEVTDLISGLDISLLSPTATGQTIYLNVTTDPNMQTNVTNGVQAFLDAYNQIMSTIDRLEADRDTQDETLPTIKTMLQNAMSAKFNVNGGSYVLADLGIVLSDPQQQVLTKKIKDKDGNEKTIEIKYLTTGQLELNVDETSPLSLFSAVLNDDYPLIQAFFSDPDNGLINSVETNTINNTILLDDPDEGIIDSRMVALNERIRRLDKALDSEESRLEQYKQSLVKKYSKLNVLLTKFDKQSAFLQQQLGALKET